MKYGPPQPRANVVRSKEFGERGNVSPVYVYVCAFVHGDVMSITTTTNFTILSTGWCAVVYFSWCARPRERNLFANISTRFQIRPRVHIFRGRQFSGKYDCVAVFVFQKKRFATKA